MAARGLRACASGDGIRPSVDGLYRDGTVHISREMHKQCFITRPMSPYTPSSFHTRNRSYAIFVIIFFLLSSSSSSSSSSRPRASKEGVKPLICIPNWSEVCIDPKRSFLLPSHV